MQFLLPVLLKVTLVAVIGRLAIAAMPRASASTRYLIAVTTLCSMLMIPVIGASGFEWRLPVLPAHTQKVVAVEADDSPTEGVAQTLSSAPERTDRSVRATPPLTNEAWAVIAAFAVAALFIARMLFGISAVIWITRRAHEVTDEAIARDFDHAATQLGVTRFARLLISDRVSVPLMWGITRPALLLPAEALGWSRDRLRVVFLHELAHLRRCDALTLLITRATTAMYWFHPLAWSLERIARRECEQACDDLVLATGARASEYADHLLSIAQNLPRHDAFASVTLAMSRRSQLEGRLLSILQIDVRRGVVSRPAAIAAAALAALLVLPIGSVRLTAQTATPAPAQTGVIEGIKQGLRKEVATTVTHTVSALAASLNEKQETRKAEHTSTSEKKEQAYTLDDLDNAIAAVRKRQRRNDIELAKDKYGSRYNDQYDSLRASGSRNAEQWAKVGARLLSNRDFSRAIDALNEAIRLDPFLGNAWYNLGCAYALSGDTHKALDYVEQSLLHGFSGGGEKLLSDEDLESIRGRALDELARLADDLALNNGGDDDDWSDAIARYESVARAHPNIARTWFNLGFAQCEGGKEREAIQSFQKALNMAYRPGTTMYNIGCSYARLGDRSTAVSWLMKSAAAGFDVGAYARHDRDLDNVRDEPWVQDQMQAARYKDKDKDE